MFSQVECGLNSQWSDILKNLHKLSISLLCIHFKQRGKFYFIQNNLNRIYLINFLHEGDPDVKTVAQVIMDILLMI
jgi:hypothetical protein